VTAPAARDAGGPTVEVTGLVRLFGARRALDDVSLSLHASDCLALFGPNGAGKTTLLRVLAGLIRPTRGAARIAGVTLPAGAALRARVGLVSHHSMLYDALSAIENVTFTATLYGLHDPTLAARRALERLGIAARADTPVRLLSRGMQQRVAIARAIVHEPGVLLADEPYNGLDTSGAAALTSVLRRLRSEGATVVVVTHNVAEGLALATQAAILVDGRVVRHDRAPMFDAVAYAAEYHALVAPDVSTDNDEV
jgi:heme exporter protein A